MIEFQSIFGLIVAAIAASAVVVIVAVRRLALPRMSAIAGVIGLIALALAAGEPVFRSSYRARVVVMVDYSASTRTASYRDRVELRRRIDQLLPGDVDRRVVYFSDHEETDRPNADLPGDRTIFTPPTDVDAVLLFSDGQFESPREASPTPAVFAVIDRNLALADDAAVVDLEMRGDKRVAATVRNTGAPTQLSLSGVRTSIGEGTSIVESQLSPGATIVSAAVERDQPDAWPENDQLTISPPRSQQTERLWSGPGAPAGFREVDGLMGAPRALLSASVLVLTRPLNANEIPLVTRYVRDLGGSVVLLDGALSSDLSPLSLYPPEPKRHWIILIDSSGSMAASIDPSRTRFTAAVSAARSLVDALPPDDLVSTGGFARDLKWWTVDQSARETSTHFAPSDAPNGPTNLQAALEKVATRAKSQLPVELIVITDADATIDSAATIVERMKSANVHVSAFALSPAPTALNDIVRATGGRWLTATSFDAWPRELRELSEQIAPPSIMSNPVRVSFEESLNLSSRDVSPWRPSWLKSGATAIASSRFDSQPVILAAEQQVGLGRTCAIAFQPNAAELEAIVQRSESVPRDPRFSVSVRRDARLHITVDAFDRAANRYLEGLRLSLHLGERKALSQTGPGRYEVVIDAPRDASIGVVTNDAEFRESVVARLSLAGRYAPEFDAIGVNRASLQALARASGGRVIEPGDNTPIHVAAKPRIGRPLTSPLAILGLAAISLAIVTWRRAA